MDTKKRENGKAETNLQSRSSSGKDRWSDPVSGEKHGTVGRRSWKVSVATSLKH